MSDEIKNSNEPEENSPNKNKNDGTATGKRVFILTSEMVKQLGLDEKIKIFKDKIKVDNSIMPVSAVQVDKEKKELIIRDSQNVQVDSNLKTNLSTTNGEASNTKEVAEEKSETLSLNSENEKQTEAENKSVSKKSVPIIAHHVETLAKPLILRRSPTKNGIVVMKSPVVGNDQSISLPNKFKIIGDLKAVAAKPSAVRKPTGLVPRKLVKHPNAGTAAAKRAKVNAGAAKQPDNSEDDVIFVDAIKNKSLGSKEKSQRGFKRPVLTYSRRKQNETRASNVNSKQTFPSKVIKLSTINSNASRDDVINSQDLCQSTEELNEILQTVQVEIEEVTGDKSTSDKELDSSNKTESAKSKRKKKEKKPKKKTSQKVIKILDDSDLMMPRKRGRPRKYFLKTIPTPMLLPIKSEFDDEPEINYLNKRSDNSNSNKELENSNLNNELESSNFNEEAETSHSNQNSEVQNLNKELESSNLNAEVETSDLNAGLEVCNLNKNLNKELESSNLNEVESCHLNKELEVCNLNQNSESQNLNKELENSNLHKEIESCQFNKESEVCNLNQNSEIQNLNKDLETYNLNEVEILNLNKESASNDSKVAASVENFESVYIKDCKKTEENYEEATNYNEEVETPVDIPVVPRRRGRPRKSTTSSPAVSKKKTVSNDDQNSNNKKTVPNDDHDSNKRKRVSNDDQGSNKRTRLSNDHDEEKNNNDDDDEDDDYEENDNSAKPRKRKSRRGKKTGWYIEPDNDNEATKTSKKGKVNKDEEIQCAKCDEKMLRSKWSVHNLSKHNNTGWLQGSRDPDYENNEKLWRSVLTIAIKKKKGSLICEKCEATKRSVIGFISHYKFCGKSQEERDAMMWVCPLCKGIFMPSSQDFHERVHREEQRLASMVIDVPDEDDSKKRRRAAEKATTKILEFTKIVKDEPLPPKKSKKVKLKITDYIVKPPTSKRVPNVWKGAWSKDIAANRQAKCRNLGCEFATNDINEICKHYSLCNFIPQTEFVCKICKFFSKSQDDVANHVRSEHSDKINSGEDSDFNINELSDGSNDSDNNEDVGAGEEGDNNKRSNKNRRKLKQFDKQITSNTRAKFLRKNESYPITAANITYVPSLKWTMTFELRNYELKLFENLLPNSFNLLKNSQAQDYLPELKLSMRTKQMKNVSQDFEFVRIKIIKEENLTEEEKRDKGWKSWKQFESSIVNNVPMFFVGGPVWSMAWLPIPAPMFSHQADQYLAVSTHPTMESKYKINNSYKFKNIIQIWNLGHLDHILSVPPIPKLSYVIAHNNGTIWCMEWCPSGAYHHNILKNDDLFEGSLKRMGLLATASSDGRVHIYSLPFPEELKFEKTDDNDLPVYQTDPVIILHVNKIIAEDNKDNWQCTSLSWNKLHGHDTVAAGFSNGYVAIWDLLSKSSLLVMKNENTISINAFQHFYGHGHAVTYVGIVPVSGKNYLATSSLDRCSKVWDLEDPHCPIDNVKKGAGTNGAWMTHWPNIYTSYDDALGLGHTVSYLMGVRDPPSSIFPLLPCNSTTYGLAVSDYANGICHGTVAGDIAAIFPFQMLYIKEIDKLTKKRWLVSSVEVVDFGEPTDTENSSDQNLKDSNEQSNGYQYMPESYDACKDRFGIVFHDDLNNWKSNLFKKSNRRNPVNCETMKSIPIEQYQFTSVNRLAWNPNSWSYLWIAAGYQNGLIRILNLKSMSVDNAVMKHLPGHADSMMHKYDNDESTSVT
ncbi:uncharacterized protein LOC130675891 [Microplitis mediator]|uniref:uncharacterized protein LOC130675891 n=1 Tax=Microplitis mediator TaxID=375433 RepID=UPI00255320BF|nr:uncharacterized protein LOC130675891 [Microplitis mediator]